ncbi:MAG: non-homologous end-joining DNA ligase [Dongiaceae bacterium]
MQLHAAGRLHFDLRLEIDGVLKSWAVTRGPSLDPKHRRLAVEVEDHRLEYGTFEGTIPTGEYGGGAVMLWDRGTWIPEGDAARAHQNGRIAFELKGERPKGGFSLVRMAGRDGRRAEMTRHNWSPIKKNDRWAKPGNGDATTAGATSVKTGRTMRQIAEGAKPDKAKTAREAGSVATARDTVAGAGADGPTTRIDHAGRPRAAVGDEDVKIGAVAITHPTRVIDPSSGAIKLDLAKYYAKVADTLLLDMADRPVAVVRCPDGITGEAFFQRHPQASLAGRVGTVKDPEDKEQLLCVRNAADLVTLVQFGVIEIHPWQTHADKLDKADRVIFDLDPAPDVPFAAVTPAARLVRDRLQGLGLQSIVKTTGGKGLHVIVPLRPAASWPVAKGFVKAIAVDLARAEPKIFVATMSKAARKGRIYVDYLRNDRGSMAVGAYCVRAPPGLPVAMPLDWREVKENLAPADYNLKSVTRVALPKDWRESRSWRRGLDAKRLRAVGFEPESAMPERKKIKDCRRTLEDMARPQKEQRHKELEGKAAKLGVEIYGGERKGKPRSKTAGKPRR